MQIKITKGLRVVLISIWHTTPKRWPYFVSTVTRKLVLHRKNNALIQRQIRQLSGHCWTKYFIPVFVHSCKLIFQKNCGLQPFQFGRKTPKRWPHFISIVVRKHVQNRSSSALLQRQIRHFFRPSLNKKFVPVCSYIYANWSYKGIAGWAHFNLTPDTEMLTSLY